MSSALTFIDNLIDGFYFAGTLSQTAGQIYFRRNEYDSITWKQYQEDIGKIVNEKSQGSMPFKFAWILTGVLERIFRILNIKSPYTKVTVGIVGRDLNADSSKARRQLD